MLLRGNVFVNWIGETVREEEFWKELVGPMGREYYVGGQEGE